MATIQDIIAYVESLTKHPLNGDEGIHHGSGEREIRRATLSWMATARTLRAAVDRRDELFIGHESLYYPYDVVNMSDPPPDWRDWPINQARRRLLDEGHLTFLRLHGSVDEICILDDFARQLDLGPAVVREGWVSVHEIPACRFTELIERVKKRTGMPAMRVAYPPDPDRPVRRVGLPWGGMGLFVNVEFQQQLLSSGCDAFIAGESDCYAFRFATECGLGVIETSHELSEAAGLHHFTNMLCTSFPDVTFTFEEVEAVWTIQ